MTRYAKLLLFFVVAAIQPVFGQTNIFDCENSLKFANYLYNTAQYDLAQHELERITFFCEPDSFTRLVLLKTYRKQRHYKNANSYFQNKTFDEIASLNPDYRQEYIRLMMSQQNYLQVQESINRGLDFKEKQEHLLGTTLLMKNWNEAYAMTHQPMGVTSYKMTALKSVAERSFTAKRKKPWLATIMSVVVPGSGKMYSGYWADGAISLLFTASSGYFAYRAFGKYGSENVYSWISGGLAVSYYLSNIYGGNRAAIRYNDNLDHQFIHETEHILFSDY